jgi:hypothetical protein
MVLRRQGLRQSGLAHGHTQHAPTSVTLGQQLVKDQRLVSPVEGAQAQVHDTGGAVARVGWYCHAVGRQAG